ncbi:MULTISPECIES: hypothetical protein [unclassified Streptomyces]|uniref:hypothetical protein n=1 Tax=unclassified Streptomyces TaxID=2593676 RepID=UPI003318C68B
MAVTQESQDVDPYAATEAARDALADVGIVYPSLGVDYGSVNLGRVRPEVAIRLADQLRRGGRER